MNKLKVIHVIPTLLPGGAERLVTDLVCFSNQTKFDVGVVLLFEKTGSIFEMELEEKGHKIYSLNVPKKHLQPKTPKIFRLPHYLFAILKMAKILREVRPSVLHCHSGVQKIVIFALLFHRIPVKIHTIHSIANEDGAGSVKFFNWLAFNFFRVTPISISEEVSRTVERFYGLKSLVIHNGIDTQKFTSLGPKRIKSSEEKLILMNVARFSSEKNHELLIEAFERALREQPNLELWLVGDGSLRQEIELMVERKGLKEKVKFLGVRSDIPQLLHQADIFVLSSDYEGLPLALLEAMAAGVPVIATAVGGVPEVLGEGEYGVLVPPKDVEALARAVVELARDEKRRAELSEQGKKFAIEKFDIRNTVKEYEKLYLSLLEKKKR